MFERKKIGIALSGGGARGLSHIGVLEVLDDIGVNINAVSGCSMGAIVGAIYCAGVDLKEIEKFISTTDWKSFLLFSVFSLSRSGIINDRKVDDVLKRFLGDKTFSDCKKEFCCVAVDILGGNKVVLKSGSLREAVLASISVPGIFPPVYKNDCFLVDGGVIEPLPTESIKELGVNFIIASSIVFESDKSAVGLGQMPDSKNKENKKLSVPAILDKSMSIMHTQMVKSYLGSAHIVIEPKIGDFGFFDFVKGKEIIEAGRKAAVEKIPEIKRKLRIR
jgi:NTE family protein